MAPPIFRSSPALVVGIPVRLVNYCFILVTPRALFQENVIPGIFMAADEISFNDYKYNYNLSCGKIMLI